jgi:hypothetical protein
MTRPSRRLFYQTWVILQLESRKEASPETNPGKPIEGNGSFRPPKPTPDPLSLPAIGKWPALVRAEAKLLLLICQCGLC